MNIAVDHEKTVTIAVTNRRPGMIKVARRRRMTLAWSVWLMAAIFVFFQFYLQLSSGQIVDAVMKSFSLTTFGGGLLAGAYYYVYVLLQAPAGMLMDRYGPRLILSIGAAIVCVGCVLFAEATSLSVAIIGRALMGAGAAFAFVGCLNLIAKWFPMRRFAIMTAIVEAAGMVGAIFGCLWLADFVSRVGWRTCMTASGILAGILAVFLWLVVRNAPRRKVPLVRVTAFDLWLGVKRLLRNRVVWINGVYSGCMFSVLTVFTALWAIPFLQQSHHFTLFESTLIACCLYLGVMIGSPILGVLDVRFDYRRLILVLSAILSSAALFIVIFYVALPTWLLASLFFIAGLFVSTYVLTFAIANEIAIPTNRATCIGLTNMLCVGFSPILQPLIGWLMHVFDQPARVGQAASLWHFQ